MVSGVCDLYIMRLKNFIVGSQIFAFGALCKTFLISVYESPKSFFNPMRRLKDAVLLGHTIKNPDIVTFTSRR